jgi:hypothetical protein
MDIRSFNLIQVLLQSAVVVKLLIPRRMRPWPNCMAAEKSEECEWFNTSEKAEYLANKICRSYKSPKLLDSDSVILSIRMVVFLRV